MACSSLGKGQVASDMWSPALAGSMGGNDVAAPMVEYPSDLVKTSFMLEPLEYVHALKLSIAAPVASTRSTLGAIVANDAEGFLADCHHG